MTNPSLGYALLAAALCFSASATAQPQPKSAAPAKYVGSQACKDCHATRFAGWTEGLHARMVRPVASAGDPMPTAAEAAAAPFAFAEAQYVLGNMHRLVFLKKSATGFDMLPGEFDVTGRTWKPVSLRLWDPAATTEASPKAADPDALKWNLRCARCHTTGFAAASHSYAELSVGCEACHGPGSDHVDTKGKERMVNPELLPPERGNHICAQCHSIGIDNAASQPFPTAYRPGDDLGKTFTFAKPTPGADTALFSKSGTSRRHHAQYNEHLQSKHFESGLRCFDCHLVHRAKTVQPSKNTQLIAWTERFLLKRVAQGTCVMCHRPGAIAGKKKGKAAELDSHTRHPVTLVKRTTPTAAQPKGGHDAERLLCGECHMPSSVREDVGYALATHTFKLPSASNNGACMACHDAKGSEWVDQQLGTWQVKK